MGNPIQTIPNLPPAIGIAGPEQVWINQAGVDRRTTLADIAGLTPIPPTPPITGGGVNVADYVTFRSTKFPATTNVVYLNDPNKGGTFVLAPPGNTLRDNGGTVLVDGNGAAWQRVFDQRVNAAWFFNAPGLNPATGQPYKFGDNTGLTITAADIAANPQWIGLDRGGGPYVVGHTWDYVTLQEWVYAIAASSGSLTGSTPGHVVWNNVNGGAVRNFPGFCPPGRFRVNEQLLCIGTGLDIYFAQRSGSVLVWQGNKVGTDDTGPFILFDSIDYSYVTNLTVADGFGVRTELVSIDHTPQAVGLSPQANTFTNWNISGGFRNADGAQMTQAGIGLCPVGGSSAQGDSQLFINLFCVNSMYDGITLNGWNIVDCTFIGGNFQGCLHAGVNAKGGSYGVFDTIFEMVGTSYFGFPQQNQITLDGADCYGYPGGGFGASDMNTVIGVRSESMVAAVDGGGHVMLMNSNVVPNATTGTWSANGHYNIGEVIITTNSGATGNAASLAILVDDGGPPAFVADPASTPTHWINPHNPGWTPNQWVSANPLFGVWLRYGSNGYSQASPITASDANSITVNPAFPVGGGIYLMKIFGSSGAVAPNWNSQVVNTDYWRAPRNASTWGFTTTAGSNVISSASVGAANVGWWVVICGAKLFSNKDSQGGDAGGLDLLGAAIGKVGSYNAANHTFTLVDTAGNPVTIDFTFTDQYGYVGRGLQDGALTWLPLDWDIAFGCKRVISCSLPYGRATACQEVQMDTIPTQGRGGNFIHLNAGGGGAGYTVHSTPPLYFSPAPLAVNTSPLNLLYSSGFGGIGANQTLRYGFSIPAVTINFPVGDPSLIDEFDLAMTNNINSAVTITWGANVLAAAPTVSLGSVAGHVVIARMKWMGAAWYVVSLSALI